MDNFEIVLIKNDENILVADSVEVAKNLGVEHKSLLRKIDGYVEKFGSKKMCHEFYIESTYKNRGKDYRNYLITKKGIAQLIGGYSSAVPKAFDLNVAYINRFEEMEKQLANQFKVPKTFKEALQLALEQQERIEELELDNKVKGQQLVELQPKGTYYDLVLKSPNLINITTIAKDYGKSGQWLNQQLHNLHVQYKQSGIWLLYQDYADKGYTKTETVVINNDTNDVKIHTKWTQAGRLFIYDKLKELGILPLIEKQ